MTLWTGCTISSAAATYVLVPLGKSISNAPMRKNPMTNLLGHALPVVGSALAYRRALA